LNTWACGQKVGPERNNTGHQYSKEEKMAAIHLYNKLEHYTWVIAELGYPSRGMLMLWVKEYKSTGR
jgi:hypothetical protein